jgi:tyrosinase
MLMRPGIHGMPFKLWDNEQPLFANRKDPNVRSNSWVGYCAHATYTFPSWHRPYLAMIEVRLPTIKYVSYDF